MNNDFISTTDYDYLFKILIIGDPSVGKSSLLLRFSDNTFYDTYISTIGVDFRLKTLKLNNKIVKLQIWDTAGQERFRAITSGYYKGARGVILVFDLTNISSFENITAWLKEVENFGSDNVCRMLVGTKSDLKHLRKIKREKIEIFAVKNGMDYIETSSKEDLNVGLVFETITRNIKAGTFKFKPVDSIIISETKKDWKDKCC